MSLLGKLFGLISGKDERASTAVPVPVQRAPSYLPAYDSGNPRIFIRNHDNLVALDDQLDADIRVSLTNCGSLRSLPSGLRTGSLDLSGCTALRNLPTGLDVAFLDLNGCRALTELPADLRLRGGRLSLQNCTGITALPEGMGSVAQLDLRGCTNLRTLPDDLTVTSWIDIGGSGITRLPSHFAHLSVRRHGEPVAPSDIF